MSYEFIAPMKDPDSVLRHSFDWAAKGWLGPSETLVSCDVVSNDPALVVDQVSHLAGIVSYRVSGGEVGKKYLVTCSVQTSEGRRDDRTAMYRVGQR